MRIRELGVLAFAASVLGGCLHHRPPVPAPARGPARDSLLLLDMSRGDSVARHGPVDGGSALFDDDVIFLRAGVPAVYGREAARALFASLSPGSSWESLGGGVSYDLRSAYTFGVVARMRDSERGAGAPVRFEQYIAFWQRSVSRPWRIVAYAEVNGQPQPEGKLTSGPLPQRPPQVARQLAEATAKVRAADSLFADLNDRMGVSFAFSNTVSADGGLFGGGRLLVGPAAVREFYDSRPPGTSLSWRPAFASVAGSLDLGFTIGESVLTGRGPSGAAVQRFGKYLTVWGLQPDKAWKFLIDGGNQTR